MLVAFAALWVLACEDSGIDQSEVLAGLQLSIQSDTINVGETLHLVATGFDDRGDQVEQADPGTRRVAWGGWLRAKKCKPAWRRRKRPASA